MDIEKKPSLPDELLCKAFGLLLKFANDYFPSIKGWDEPPSVEILSDKEKFETILKKIKVTVKILISHSEKANDNNIKEILEFTYKLLQLDKTKLTTTKINLLANNAIALLRLRSASKDNKENQKEIMEYYNANLIKNFQFSYEGTFASLLWGISNFLTNFNHIKQLFVYQDFFLDEDGFINEVLVPRIKEETLKLDQSIGDDKFVHEFTLDALDYENELDLLFYLTASFEIVGLKEYKKTHSESEYQEHKQKIKEKLFKDREEKRKQAQEEAQKNK